MMHVYQISRISFCLPSFLKKWLFYNFHLPFIYQNLYLLHCIPHSVIFLHKYQSHTNSSDVYQSYTILRIPLFLKKWLFYNFHLPFIYQNLYLPHCIPHSAIFSVKYRTHTNSSDVYQLYTVSWIYSFILDDVDSHFVWKIAYHL